jgi:hypothetical protein
MASDPEDHSNPDSAPQMGNSEERLGRIEHRLESSEEQSRALTGSVQDLTGALHALEEVRRKQSAAEKRTDALAEQTVATDEESRARSSRLWRAMIGLAAGAGLLMLVINVLMFAGLTNYIVDLLEQQRADRIASCEKRNEATLSNIRREEGLAAAEPAPELARIHRESARELRRVIVDCEKATRVTR